MVYHFLYEPYHLYYFLRLFPDDYNSIDTISALFLLETIGFLYRKRYNTAIENKPTRTIEVGKICFIHDGTKTGHPGYLVWKDEVANRYFLSNAIVIKKERSQKPKEA